MFQLGCSYNCLLTNKLFPTGGCGPVVVGRTAVLCLLTGRLSYSRSSYCYVWQQLSYRNQQRRFYQCKTGVYGHKPGVSKITEVKKETLESRIQESNFFRLVTAYRKHGHKKAQINPINLSNERVTLPVLDPKRYGLDKQERFKFSGILSTASEEGTLQEAVQFLEKTYCDKISAEFEDLEEEEEIEWFTKRIEQIGSEDVDKAMQVALATELLKSQTLDKFLATKFVTLKRYGGEGAESMMAFIMELLRLSAKDGVEQIVIGMPHRGRFNLLTGLLRLSPVQLFRKFKGLSEFPTNVKATGDVASHLISSVDLNVGDKFLHVTVLNNPSHLEVLITLDTT